MAFVDAIRKLNSLKRQRVIRDYVIIGAVAATAYMEPIFTEDLDIIVLVDTDEEYLRAFRKLAEFADSMKGMHYVLGGVPVQVFPATTSPLFRDTLEQARTARVGTLRVKVPSPEHLALLYLGANRDKDKLRLSRLMQVVSKRRLYALLQRFDDEKQTLARNLQAL